MPCAWRSAALLLPGRNCCLRSPAAASSSRYARSGASRSCAARRYSCTPHCRSRCRAHRHCGRTCRRGSPCRYRWCRRHRPGRSRGPGASRPSSHGPDRPQPYRSRQPPHCRRANAATAFSRRFPDTASRRLPGTRWHSLSRSGPSGFFHRRVQRVAGAEGLAAALAGAVSRFQRIEALGRALQCLQLLIQKPITNRKGAGLIKMDS